MYEDSGFINQIDREFFSYLMFNLTHAPLLFIKDKEPITEVYQEKIGDLLNLIEKYRQLYNLRKLNNKNITIIVIDLY